MAIPQMNKIILLINVMKTIVLLHRNLHVKKINKSQIYMMCTLVLLCLQEDNVLEVHLLGAVLAFGGAGVYCWVQSYLSYKMKNLPKVEKRCLSARVVLSICHIICFFTSILFLKHRHKVNATQCLLQQE